MKRTEKKQRAKQCGGLLILLVVVAAAFSGSQARAATIINGGDFGEGVDIPIGYAQYGIRFNGPTTQLQNFPFDSDAGNPNITYTSTVSPFSGTTPVFPADTGTPDDLAMSSILSGGVYGGAASGSPLTFTLNNLRNNFIYDIYVLATGAGFGAGREDILSVDGVILDSVVMNDTNAYLLHGRFLASGTSASVLIDGGANIGTFAPVISALFLVAPEPSSIVLAGMGVVGVAVAARRRRKS